MQGVGPGSLLGGRYLVQRRVSQHSRYERWVAADQTLDREVVLLCFDADGPVASPALDAARRAAGVDEPRLVRVLDVGRDDATAFVVEESLNGARSVTSVLTDGGLPAEEARRIVGEAASALERARARGLHHGVLTPRSVFRLADGSVKVRGLATEAALVEADDIPPDQATRRRHRLARGAHVCVADQPLAAAGPGLGPRGSPPRDRWGCRPVGDRRRSTAGPRLRRAAHAVGGRRPADPGRARRADRPLVAHAGRRRPRGP